MRSYPSWIAGLRYRAPDGLNRGRYCAKHLLPGATLDLLPEPDNPQSEEGNAVAIKFRGRHLGFIPSRHEWVGRALSEGTALRCVVIRVEVGGWLFSIARSVALRIDVLDGSGPGGVRKAVGGDSIAHPAADVARRNREQRAREACMDGLRVLAYLALSDDMLTQEELNIEASYIESRLAMSGFDHDPDLTETLIVIARGLVVPKRSFARVVNAVAGDEAHFRLVWDAAQQLAATARKMSKIEVEALDRLQTAGRGKGWIA
jgi:hypothetical protein